MPEMPHARQQHCHLVLVRRCDYIGITHRATRLNGGGGPGFGRSHKSIRKWEESVAADRAALERQASLACFPDGNSARIDAAHLPRTDSESAARRGINNGVGFNVFN